MQLTWLMFVVEKVHFEVRGNKRWVIEIRETALKLIEKIIVTNATMAARQDCTTNGSEG
jgi:hypothetical protein